MGVASSRVSHGLGAWDRAAWRSRLRLQDRGHGFGHLDLGLKHRLRGAPSCSRADRKRPLPPAPGRSPGPLSRVRRPSGSSRVTCTGCPPPPRGEARRGGAWSVLRNPRQPRSARRLTGSGAVEWGTRKGSQTGQPPCLPPSLSSCSVTYVERVGVASCLNVVNFIVKGIIFCLLRQTCSSRPPSRKCPFYSFCLLMSVRLKNKINNNKIMKNNKTGRWQVPNRQESFTSSGLHGLQVISSQEICA